MKDIQFVNEVYREISYRDASGEGNIIKGDNACIEGKVSISIEQESIDGVKIVLKKDEQDNIKEIKFVCSCGETKSVLLDYTD